jgi:hypothetical protein
LKLQPAAAGSMEARLQEVLLRQGPCIDYILEQVTPG